MAKKKKGGPGPQKKGKAFKYFKPGGSEGADARKVDNPFEKYAVKRKHDILGRRIKGEVQQQGVARGRAIDVRKKTLLEEYKNSGKVNAFKDKRIGENDPELADEDKMLKRYEKSKVLSIKQKRKNFSLEDEPVLTHLGKSLGDLSNMNDNPMDSDDEVDRRDLVGQLQFGGGEDKDVEEGPKKTRKEIMDEIIAKSKAAKAEKRKEKEVAERLLTKLDEDFKDVRNLVHRKPTKAETLKNPSLLFGGGDSDDEADDFDKIAKQLVLEARSTVTDRKKTDEELAREEAKKLEEMEQKRLRRMRGEAESDDKTGGDANGPSADDLGANYEIDEEFYGRMEMSKKRKASDQGVDEDEDDEDEDDDEEEEEEEGEDEDDEDDDDDEEEEEEEGEESGGEEIGNGIDLGDDGESDLGDAAQNDDDVPFAFTFPSSYSEFKDIARGRSAEQLGTILTRIRTQYHVAVDAKNRQRLQSLVGFLMKHFYRLCTVTPVSTDHLDVLTTHMFQLTQAHPVAATLAAKEMLMVMSNDMVSRLNGDGADASLWPSVSTLMFLRLVADLFPVSDMQHAVTTPCLIMMGRMLSQCATHTPRDVAAGLYVCNMVLEYTTESERYVPEALRFLADVVSIALTPETNKDQRTALRSSVCPTFVGALDWFRVTTAKETFGPLDIPTALYEVPENFSTKDCGAFVQSAYFIASGMLVKFAELHKAKQFLPQLIAPSIALMEKAAKGLSKDMKKANSAVLSSLKDLSKKVESQRGPLQWQKKKAIPIKAFNPKFEDDYRVGTDYDVDRDRAALRKEKKKYKQEIKGAVRELKKDNYFIAEQKYQEETEARKEKAEQQKEIWSFLEGQQRMIKTVDRLKNKISGKKGLTRGNNPKKAKK